MYKVVLIDKNTGEANGDIGIYDDLEEAHAEATDYNRKGDRHAGHAVVETKIGERPLFNQRMGDNSQSRVSRMKISSNQSRPRIQLRQRQPHAFVEEESSSEETSTEDFVPDHYQKNPNWHRSTNNQSQKQFVFLVNTYNGNGIVLEQNRFLNNFLLANPNFSIQSEGLIHEMISERNQYLASRKR